MVEIFLNISEVLVLCCLFDFLWLFFMVRLDKEFNLNEILNFLVKIFLSYMFMGDFEYSKDFVVRVRFLEMSFFLKVSCWCGFIYLLFI